MERDIVPRCLHTWCVSSVAVAPAVGLARHDAVPPARSKAAASERVANLGADADSVSEVGAKPDDVGSDEFAIAPLGPDRTVEQMLVREIRSLIVDGYLEPGRRLPYRSLAEQFQVSVTPVRIALRELAKDGLVEILRAGGVRVAPLSLDELEELFATRVGLESRLAHVGASALSDDDLAQMEPVFREIQHAVDVRDRPAYVTSTLDYRLLCYIAARRPRLLGAVRLLFRRSARYNRLVVDPEVRFFESFELMVRFREACVARNGLAAQDAVRGILERSLDYFTTHPLAFEPQRGSPPAPGTAAALS